MARSGSKKKPKKAVARPARPARTRRQRALGSGANPIALAAFAHDIRTSLTGILALGELLASSSLGERERRWAIGIKGGAEHLAALTTLAIDAAGAAAGALTLMQEPFRPLRLIDALTESLTARAQMKGLAAETACAGDLPGMLVGDAARLRAAIENLIDNAVKFTERGAVRLDVRARRAARGRLTIVFAVTDSGIGLTRAEIKRLFRPFTQANADTARRYGGAGLGLSVVKRLAKLMGGDLTVTSTSRRGSCFRFRAVLPIAPPAAGEDAGAAQSGAPAARLAILCAEDNPYGRVILNTILGEMGHRIDFVGSGEEAVAAVARGYDLVLMDITLPGIDGLEAARRIRALGGGAGAIPIAGISGRTAAGDEQAARAAGMDLYLHKPLSPSALGEAIAAMAAKREG